MPEKPLATCAYGWGRTLKLYQKYLDVDGTLYELNDLMYVHALYRCIMNISSLRLAVQFHERPLVLRGISVNEDAERVVAHLKCYCPGAIIEYETKATEKAMQKSKLHKVSMGKSTEQPVHAVQSVERESEQYEAVFARSSRTAVTPQWLLELAHDMQHKQSRKPHTSLHGGSGKRRDGGDTDYEQIARHLQADTLPSLTIPVPLRLAQDEQARYSIEATLCSEPLDDGSATPNYSYPAKDQGTLILTNRRLIYMGRRGQRILGYASILRVSRLRGAIALLIDVSGSSNAAYSSGNTYTSNAPRTQRETFQVSRPLECALYLDHLLRQFYAQIATQHLAPNMPPSSMGTPIPSGVPETAQQQAIPHIRHAASQSRWHYSARATDRVAIPASVDVADIETRPTARQYEGRGV